MLRPSETQAVRQAEALLREWLDEDAHIERPHAGKDAGADLLVRLGRPVLVVEVKVTSDSASIAPLAAQARHNASRIGKAAVPVVVVPFMGEVGRRLCEQAAVSWFDLSGNAEIVAPGLRIHIEGKPNKYKKPGRPSTVFSPRSSRLVRQLLMDPGRAVTQRELALLVDQTKLPTGEDRQVGTLDLDVGLALAILDDQRYQALTDPPASCAPRSSLLGDLRRCTRIHHLRVPRRR